MPPLAKGGARRGEGPKSGGGDSAALGAAGGDSAGAGQGGGGGFLTGGCGQGGGGGFLTGGGGFLNGGGGLLYGILCTGDSSVYGMPGGAGDCLYGGGLGSICGSPSGTGLGGAFFGGGLGFGGGDGCGGPGGGASILNHSGGGGRPGNGVYARNSGGISYHCTHSANLRIHWHDRPPLTKLLALSVKRQGYLTSSFATISEQHAWSASFFVPPVADANVEMASHLSKLSQRCSDAVCIPSVSL